MVDDTSTALSERERAILDAEIRGSAAEFLGWLSGLTPPTEREAIPPEMRAAFDKMCGRLATAVATVVYCREDTANRASTDGLPEHWVKAAQNIIELERDPAKREEARGMAVMLVKTLLANTPRKSPVNACPRPVNTAPEGKTAAQCIADGECGCDASPVNDGADLQAIRHRSVQALHAGISRRNWNATENAANDLRDRIDDLIRRITSG